MFISLKGTSVLQVVAQDGDRGFSNSVNYTLLSGKGVALLHRGEISSIPRKLSVIYRLYNVVVVSGYLASH